MSIILLTDKTALRNLSHNLKKLRVINNVNITQQMLARKLHVSRSTVSKFETGEQMPSAVTAVNLSRVFHTNVETLLCSEILNEGRDETE